ncbi:hypothetical protein L1987_88783 [Smallanthus sonchifolius]|nr:hypothetical protein L1987_89797 [Smallanthus sonchifolius]KAI3664586.1 hypothetical protein L1987_89650 [Smallanthus sonchifolius]KAI3664657.1 hypothetical protein L1987_89576 [Smallanthus sonchifolius]KAI3666688.1 hypothetical protein L1987_88783 [Smallanthus sonchifolius]
MGKNLASKETKKKTKKISIIVRRPSLKWNFHAGARTSMKVDLLQPARLTSYQPAKGCEAGPGTKNESISVHGRAGGRSTVRAQCSGIASDSTKFASALLKGLHSYGGFVNEPVDKPTEATFLSALFKRLASARKRRQGHKVSEVASLSQEGPIRIPPLFPFPSAPFPRNEKEDGTLELYYLSAYCLPKILLLQLVGHRVIQISRVFRGFPMLQLPYQFGRSGMDRLNIPLGSLVLTFLCGIHSRSALGITSSSGGNSSQNPTTSPTSLPPTLSRTSIETEWFHVLSSIGYSFPFVSLSPISVSISSQD